MNKNAFRMLSTLVLVTLLIFTSFSSFAQSDQFAIEDRKLSSTILHLDSLFWKSYNECNTEQNGRYLTDDVEFFHDKGGITYGKTALVASLKNNLCSNSNFRIRREAVEGTVKVYPLRKGNSIYGAIILGEHYFYVKENDKPESRNGLAKFTHVWLLKDNEWKMSDILSYDHGPANN